MKKIYENPEFIYVQMLSADVITASKNHSDMDVEDNETSDDIAVLYHWIILSSTNSLSSLSRSL